MHLAKPLRYDPNFRAYILLYFEDITTRKNMHVRLAVDQRKCFVLKKRLFLLLDSFAPEIDIIRVGSLRICFRFFGRYESFVSCFR